MKSIEVRRTLSRVPSWPLNTKSDSIQIEVCNIANEDILEIHNTSRIQIITTMMFNKYSKQNHTGRLKKLPGINWNIFQAPSVMYTKPETRKQIQSCIIRIKKNCTK